MLSPAVIGALMVTAGGLLSGAAAWPMKLMKHYRFEHWWFISMLTGLVVVPWTATLAGCPHPFRAYAEVPWRTLVTANLWATGWGVANVLCGICYVRLGMALTTALITGLGVAIGVTLPMVAKGSGIFAQACDPGSPAGLTVLGGAGVMLIAVVMAGLAGRGREQALGTRGDPAGAFVRALAMALISGVLSCGMALSFVYGQGPIMEAMTRQGAGEIPATFAVWAVGLLGGAMVSIVYPAWLMTRNRSWRGLAASPKEFFLAGSIGANVSLSVVLIGSGMRALGALGASVGFGVQAAAWMLGGQGVGFVSGEWRGVRGRPRRQMGLALVCLLLAVLLMVLGNLLAGG
jgi:hypothetical protein